MWQIEFSPKKCYTMWVSFKREPPLAKFYFCDKILENVNSHPYLGVEIDNRLRWKEHINHICNIANRMLGLREISGSVRRASKRR